MAGASLRADVPELTRAFARYRSLLDELPAVQPLLVHGDYYPANVLTGADGGIAAVIDFSPLTVVGDWRADLVSAVCFMEELADPPCEARDDARTCLKNAMVDPDGDIFLTYRAFHAFVHSGSRVEIPELYRWCVAVLRSLAG
jgi:aminoglycoside phosphotransferase (APT) family kinase protein